MMHSHYAGKWSVKETRSFVLILVVMDDALALIKIFKHG